jgi:hypothetical protein
MPNWMTTVRANTAGGAYPFGARPLNEIVVPGTHDAGCYTNNWFHQLGRTQTQTVAGQLAGGIRYFDLRPIPYGGQFWIYHGNAWFGYYGGRVDGAAGILQDVADFMAGAAAGAHELVVLNFSHFRSFNATTHLRLIAEIRLRLGPYLVPHRQDQIDLFNATFDDIRTDANGTTSRVAILYDGALDTALEAQIPALPAGFFRLSPKYTQARCAFLFDQYAASNTLVAMQNDQMNKLANRNNYPYTTQPWGAFAGNWPANAPWAAPPVGIASTWHLFSWTLTPQPWGTPLNAAQNRSNPALEGWFTGPNWPIGAPNRGYDPRQDPRINVIYVDDYASATHVNAASPMNGWAVPVALCRFINEHLDFNPGGVWPGWGGY